MCLNKEIEWSIIDIVRDWSTECLSGLTAEHNIKACFLAWWDHLRKRATFLELWVLINEDSNIDVLSQVVGDDEALGGGGLNKDCFEVNLLWACVNLLKLLT